MLLQALMHLQHLDITSFLNSISKKFLTSFRISAVKSVFRSAYRKRTHQNRWHISCVSFNFMNKKQKTILHYTNKPALINNTFPFWNHICFCIAIYKLCKGESFLPRQNRAHVPHTENNMSVGRPAWSPFFAPQYLYYTVISLEIPLPHAAVLFSYSVKCSFEGNRLEGNGGTSGLTSGTVWVHCL